MKYEYTTTIVHVNNDNTIKVEPPDDTGWSLLSFQPSGTENSVLYYTWAKQKPLTQFSSSDSDFQRSIEILKIEPNLEQEYNI